MSIDFTPDQLVQSFLTAAKKIGVAALVTYGFVDGGKPVMRIASNSDEKGTQGILAWMNKADDAAIEAAAKSVHEAMKLVPGPWSMLPDSIKDKYRTAVKVGLKAVKENSGRSLNIEKPLIS